MKNLHENEEANFLLKPHKRYGYLKGAHREAYDFCFFVHDELVKIAKTQELGVFSHIFKANEECYPSEDCTGEDLADWLEKHGYNEEIAFSYCKISISALLNDFLNYIYESIQCLKKGKTAVAYSLLRKPIKENLLYFEWILVEPELFFRHMVIPPKKSSVYK